MNKERLIELVANDCLTDLSRSTNLDRSFLIDQRAVDKSYVEEDESSLSTSQVITATRSTTSRKTTSETKSVAKTNCARQLYRVTDDHRHLYLNVLRITSDSHDHSRGDLK